MNQLVLSLLLATLVFAQNSTHGQNATTFALQYGYPLLAWQRHASDINQTVGVNALQHARQLSTPANRTVVKPNVDTLYSVAVYDLSESNVALSLPAVPEETFKLFSFYDSYGFNWVNVGTGGFFRNGSYLLQPSEDGSEALRVTNGSYHVAELNAPSDYGTVLIRWGLNETNEDMIHEYQDATGIEEVERSRDESTLVMTPSLESLLAVYDPDDAPAENVLNLLARYEEGNPALTSQLQAAGISDGS